MPDKYEHQAHNKVEQCKYAYDNSEAVEYVEHIQPDRSDLNVAHTPNRRIVVIHGGRIGICTD